MIPYCSRVLSVGVVVIFVLPRSDLVTRPAIKWSTIVLSVYVNCHVGISIVGESHNGLCKTNSIVSVFDCTCQCIESYPCPAASRTWDLVPSHQIQAWGWLGDLDRFASRCFSVRPRSSLSPRHCLQSMFYSEVKIVRWLRRGLRKTHDFLLFTGGIGRGYS